MARAQAKGRAEVTPVAKIIYIAGYGRSGSTLLSIVLGNHPDIVDVGEVTFLANEWGDARRLCACGQPYAACAFWRDAPAALLNPKNAAVIRRTEQLASLPRLLSNRIPAEQQALYHSLLQQLCQYVFTRSGASILVDSSKSARNASGRFLALTRLARQDVYVVHLIRNGLAVTESRAVTGSNLALRGIRHTPRFPALRATLGWVITNLGVMWLARFLPAGRYLRLRFETFLEAPQATLRQVGAFAGFDPGPLLTMLDQGAGFRAGHEVGGNRIRQAGVIHLRAHTRPPGHTLPRRQRLLFTLLGGWLNRHFGYH